jgi:hypothetical protein
VGYTQSGCFTKLMVVDGNVMETAGIELRKKSPVSGLS